MSRKLSAVILFPVVLFVFLSCSRSVRTYLLPDGASQGSTPETGRVYSVTELMPDGLSLNEFSAFDGSDRLIGWFTAGNDNGIMLFDAFARTGQQIIDTSDNIVSVSSAAGDAIVYETSENNVRSLYRYDKSNADAQLLGAYSADSALVFTDAYGQAYSIYRINDDLRLLSIKADGSITDTDIMYMLISAMKENYSSSIKATAALADAGGGISCVLLSSGRYYVVRFRVGDDGNAELIRLFECKGTEHTVFPDSIYCISEDGRLIRTDTASSSGKVIAENVKLYSVSDDQSTVAWVCPDKGSERVYAARSDGTGGTMAYICKRAEALMLNPNGTYLFLQYCDRLNLSEKKYSLTELIH